MSGLLEGVLFLFLLPTLSGLSTNSVGELSGLHSGGAHPNHRLYIGGYVAEFRLIKDLHILMTQAQERTGDHPIHFAVH